MESHGGEERRGGATMLLVSAGVVIEVVGDWECAIAAVGFQIQSGLDG